MKHLTIGPWEVEVDVEGTARVYKETKRGSPGDCTCDECRNLQLLGPTVYPLEFRTLMTSLGVDVNKAAEIHEWNPEIADGRKEYGGWFHCIGKIVNGPLNATAQSCVDQWSWHQLADGFKVVIDTKRDLAFKEFGDAPLVRLEFFGRFPWTLKA